MSERHTTVRITISEICFGLTVSLRPLILATVESQLNKRRKKQRPRSKPAKIRRTPLGMITRYGRNTVITFGESNACSLFCRFIRRYTAIEIPYPKDSPSVRTEYLLVVSKVQDFTSTNWRHPWDLHNNTLSILPRLYDGRSLHRNTH